MHPLHLRPIAALSLVVAAASVVGAQTSPCPIDFGGFVLRDLGSISSPLASPRFIVTGDVSQDGKAELIVAGDSTSGGIRIFGGTTAPSGLTSQPTLTFTSLQNSGLAIGDLNGDQLPDFATCIGTNINWRANNGAVGGGFNTAVNVTASDSGGPIVFGDLNNDGITDIVLLNRSTSAPRLIIVRGIGSGSFAAAVNYPGSPTLPLGARIRLVDLNRDGLLDVVCGGAAPGAASGTNVYIFRNLGACGMANPVSVPLTGAPNGVAAFDVADVNGDGRPDIVFAPFGAPGLGTAINTGLVPGASGDVAFSAGPVLTGSNIPTVADFVTADLNNDGQADVAGVASGSPVQFWAMGNGAGGGGLAMSTSRTFAGSGGGSATAIVAADFNGDGLIDVAWLDSTNARLYSSLNFTTIAGAGLSAQPPRIVSTPAGVAATITVGPSGLISSVRWYKDRVALSDGPGISGSATPTLSFTPLAADDGAVFYCRIAGCNSAPIDSNFATLRVTTPTCLADVGRQGGLVGADGFLDNNDFVVFIDAFFSHTGCP